MSIVTMSGPTVHQRVYRNKGKHRHIGVITDVVGDHVRVLWDGASQPSGLTCCDGLTVVSIRHGATVVRGSTSPIQPITSESPAFGIVSDISVNSAGDPVCAVTWDDRTVTVQPIADVSRHQLDTAGPAW